MSSQRDASPERDRRAVAGQGVGVRGDAEHPSVPTGGEQNRLRTEHVELSGRELVGHDARGPAVVGPHQVEAVELVEEPDVALHALLVQRLEDHVSRSVRGVACALDGPLAVIRGVSPETTLVDQPVRCPVEGEPPALQLVDGGDRLLGQDLGGRLVHEIVAALHGVEGVPLRVVLLDVAERRADAALGRARVGPRGIELRDDGRLHPAGGLDRRAEACSAGADDHGVVRVGDRHVVGHFAGSKVTTMIVPSAIRAAPRTVKNELMARRTPAGRT